MGEPRNVVSIASKTAPAEEPARAAAGTAGKGRLGADGAADRVRERIQSGALRPGERIREEALAAELGLSRTPVREALRRLEAEGYLAHQPHRGVVVRELDHQAVTELYLMREVLEGTAAAQAARHASDAEVATLAEMLDEGARAADDSARSAHLNRLFHRALYRGAHNRYLMAMLNGLDVSMTLLGRTTLALPGRGAEAIAEHRAIVERIAAHDPAGAEAAARAHIHAAHRARLRVMFEDEAR